MITDDSKSSANLGNNLWSKLAGGLGLRVKPQASPVVVFPAARPQNRATITVTQVPGSVPVSVLHLRGSLDAGCYLEVIETVRQAYLAGARRLVFDMSEVNSIGLSTSIVALHSIAVLLRGELPLDPEAGWDALYLAQEEAATAGPQTQFKLLKPRPQVYQALDQAGLLGFLEVYPDLDTALASFR